MPLIIEEDKKKILNMKQTLCFERMDQLNKNADVNVLRIGERNVYFSKPRVEKEKVKTSYYESTKDLHIKTTKSIIIKSPPKSYYSSCCGGGGSLTQSEFHNTDGSFDLEGSRSAHGHGWNNYMATQIIIPIV